MKLTYKTDYLQLIHPFTISSNSRTFTPIVFITLESDGLIGFGEASLPPYLPDNQENVIEFLQSLNLQKFHLETPVENVLDYIFRVEPDHFPAKAALDMALYDLYGKKENKPLYKIFNSLPDLMPETSCTIGIDSEEIIKQKVEELERFCVLKVKLGTEEDKNIIQTIRKITNKPIYIDANQGWKTSKEALEKIEWLYDQNIVMIEQPMPKNMILDQQWLHERSPLPLIADEDCQGIQDIEGLNGRYSGFNIKLMKCGGLREAQQMIELGREASFKIMIGCMNESSCAVMAAATLAPKADWVDLDGPFLIQNNPFEDPEIKNGKIVLKDSPGIGLTLRKG